MRGYPCCECCRTDTIHPDHHVVPCPTCNNPTVDRLRAEVERLTQQIETAKRIDREQVLAQHECPSTDLRALKHYRHPRLDGQTECPECGYPMHEHGWLDCGGDGIVVCPSLHGPFGGAVRHRPRPEPHLPDRARVATDYLRGDPAWLGGALTQRDWHAQLVGHRPPPGRGW